MTIETPTPAQGPNGRLTGVPDSVKEFRVANDVDATPFVDPADQASTDAWKGLSDGRHRRLAPEATGPLAPLQEEAPRTVGSDEKPAH